MEEDALSAGHANALATQYPIASRTTGHLSRLNWAMSWTEAGPKPSR